MTLEENEVEESVTASDKIAKFVMDKSIKGIAAVYQMFPPLEGYEYVWVSAVDAFDTGDETYIFGCTPDGDVLSWGELPGSFKGAQDHARALGNVGYVIV